ncbi:hypothetical protein ColTof4_05859 [Colletotrichum tofieldiae]|nr:hypothetical protein ColTof3_01031 [Colletotrichum tofieldiae]GKT73436.1 hypothetical protein ColTof4_05859 [Colletotrichum tofieldiae]
MSPKSSSGRKFICKEPGCSSRPFARKDTLQRHINEVHNPAARVSMSCGLEIKPRKYNIERHRLTCTVCKGTELDITSMLEGASSDRVSPAAGGSVGDRSPKEMTPEKS